MSFWRTLWRNVYLTARLPKTLAEFREHARREDAAMLRRFKSKVLRLENVARLRSVKSPLYASRAAEGRELLNEWEAREGCIRLSEK
jgi:hypothetical protein